MNMLFAVAILAQCPAPSGVAAEVRNGQTFITWQDPATGAAGAGYRYRIYRDITGPVTVAGTVLQERLNNSGQMLPAGRGNINQTWRQNATRRMVNIVSDGAPLVFGTGLAVATHAATETAWYGVSTFHVSGGCAESAPVSSGPVYESPAPIVPIRQLKDQDFLNTGLTQDFSPLWVQLHGSGSGYPANRGDLYQWYGDSTHGWQSGIEQAFALWRDRKQGTFPCAPVRCNVYSPQDAIPTRNGLTPFSLETFHTHYYWQPPGLPARVYPFTTAKMTKEIDFVLNGGVINTDRERVQSWGRSMGGWEFGIVLDMYSTFAAHFKHMPRWRPANNNGVAVVPSIITGTTVVATGFLMADGTPFSAQYDIPAKMAVCTNQYRPIFWAIGKQDGLSRWQDHLDMVAAMEGCKRPFAFRWSNGTHSTDNSLAPLLTEYGQVYRRNVSHPAFTASSLNGNPAVDAAGCINCGWTWTVLSDTANTWSAIVANTNNVAGVTVQVTPRNTQAFTVAPGETINWTCAGCLTPGETVTGSAFGTATATIQIPAGVSATLTFTK